MGRQEMHPCTECKRNRGDIQDAVGSDIIARCVDLAHDLKADPIQATTLAYMAMLQESPDASTESRSDSIGCISKIVYNGCPKWKYDEETSSFVDATILDEAE